MRPGGLAGLLLLLSASLIATATLLDDDEKVIPWRQLPIAEEYGPPTAPPPPVSADATVCRDENVVVKTTGPQPLNSATTMYGVGLRNAGTEPCVVRSRPTVRVVNGRVRINRRRASAFVLPPGEATGADLAVGTCHHSSAGEAVLAVGYRSRTKLLRIPACRAGAQWVDVSPYLELPPPEPKLERFPLAAELRVPRWARAGSTLHFRVALENAARRPFRFPFCPFFEGGVMGAAHVASTLNCRPVGTLEPGAEVVFDLQARLRADAAPGRYEVYWYADDGTLTGSILARDAIELRSR
jgi:hypothetical protein